MISINWIGIVIMGFVYLPYIFYVIFGKEKNKAIKHKQIRIIELIGKSGVLFFGFLNFYGYGYSFYNVPLQIIWISLFFILILWNYFCWLRYFLNGRKEEFLYKSLLHIPYPIGISECILFFLSGALLWNPFVIVFSIIYGTSHIYLGLRR